jgi:hypothetical protein
MSPRAFQAEEAWWIDVPAPRSPLPTPHLLELLQDAQDAALHQWRQERATPAPTSHREAGIEARLRCHWALSSFFQPLVCCRPLPQGKVDIGIGRGTAIGVAGVVAGLLHLERPRRAEQHPSFKKKERAGRTPNRVLSHQGVPFLSLSGLQESLAPFTPTSQTLNPIQSTTQVAFGVSGRRRGTRA